MKPVYELNLTNILTIMKKQRKILFFNMFTIPIIILIVSFVIPYNFTSSSMILPPEESFDPLLYGFTGIGEGISGGISRAFLGGGLVSEMWITILRSRNVMLSTVNNLNLYDFWELENRDDAYEKMISCVSYNITPEGIIYLYVTTEDPILSKKINFEMINNLDKINQDLLQQNASNRKLFIKKSLIKAQDSMVILENEILNFSQSHNIINIELEAEPIILALSTLKAQVILLEAELSGLSTEMTSFHPQRRSLEANLNTIKNKINEIEKEGGNGLGLGFSVPLESLPVLVLEYARLEKDYKVQAKIFELLIQEFERAKIAELKNTPTLKVVDWPEIPEKKSYPKRSIFLLVGIFIGFALGVLFSLLKNKIEEELKKKEVREKWEKIIYEW